MFGSATGGEAAWPKSSQALGAFEISEVAGMEGSLLKLTTQVKLACEKINDQPQTRQLVSSLLSEVLGYPCNIQCTLVGGRSAKTKNVQPDGLVATALRDLGGEIVED